MIDDGHIHTYILTCYHTHTHNCVYTIAQIETAWNLWWQSVTGVYTGALEFYLINFILFTK